jgi:hypothetical protein
MSDIFRQFTRAWVALALLSGSWLSFPPETCAQNAPSGIGKEVITQRGVAFRREVESRYRELKAHGLVKSDNDVMSIALKYLSIGMRFEDAEDILRAASCAVSGRHYGPPPPTSLEDQMWTARVSAICKVSESRWDNGTDLTVLLYPKAPTDYSFVGDIKASIVVQSF